MLHRSVSHRLIVGPLGIRVLPPWPRATMCRQLLIEPAGSVAVAVSGWPLFPRASKRLATKSINVLIANSSNGFRKISRTQRRTRFGSFAVINLFFDDYFRLLTAILALKSAHFAFQACREWRVPDETGICSATRANSRWDVGGRFVSNGRMSLRHNAPPYPASRIAVMGEGSGATQYRCW